MFHLSKPLNRLDLRLHEHWLLPCDFPHRKEERARMEMRQKSMEKNETEGTKQNQKIKKNIILMQISYCEVS